MGIDYRVSFPNPAVHLAAVEVQFAKPDTGSAELWMPGWTPGSYLIREYSRNVQELEAKDASGHPLDVVKSKKNVWLVSGRGPGPWRVTYKLYCREKSVRTNWVDAEYSLLNGASTFLTVRGLEQHPHQVELHLPEPWEQAWCALPVENRAFVAADLDELVDSPILCGNQNAYVFEVGESEVVLLNQGEAGLWDGEQAAEDVEAIVRAYVDMFNGFPCRRYLFFNLIVESRGGLEHKDSTVLMTSRYVYRDREAYISWLGLVSHEFFHVWNIKRSRPVELGPFDYEHENYTRSLWVAEGLTAYYTDLMPCRAGLTSTEEYLKTLSTLIEKLHSIPGRHLQSLEDSSFDAWIKLYRPDENSMNSTVSYYLKGAVVGWLLDVEIRRRSAHQKSLDDVMRTLFERYSGKRGFTPEEMQRVVEEVADGSMADFFNAYVRGRDELNFENALETLGLRFGESSKENPWLGAILNSESRNVIVEHVRSDSPAYAAGINVEDEIVALGGFRVSAKNFEDRLKQYKPGDTVELLVSRFDAMETVSVALGAEPVSWKLEIDPGAKPEAKGAREQWLAQAAT